MGTSKCRWPDHSGCRAAVHHRALRRPVRLAAAGFDDILEGAKARALCVHQDRHVAWHMLVLPHLGVCSWNVGPGKHFGHDGCDASLDVEAVGLARLQQIGEVRALNALLAHPDIARIEGDVVAGGAGAEDDHAAALHDETRYRESGFAWVFEHHVDIVALAGDVPDRLAEFARFFGPSVIFRRTHFGHRAPAIEILAIDDAFGAERHDEVAFALVAEDADGIGAGDGAELNRE